MKYRKALSFWLFASFVATFTFFCATRTANAQATGSISGNIVDETNQPIAGIWVNALNGACGGVFVNHGLTDVSGNYTIAGLPPGSYSIHTWNDQFYGNKTWDGVTACQDATPVTVIANQVTPNINFTLTLGGNVSGKVTDVASLPIQGVNVNAFTAACGGDFLGGSLSDSSGNYTITGVPAGNVYVSTWNQLNFINEWWNGVFDCNAATPVTITVSQVTPDIDFSIAAGGSISGHIDHGSGLPLAGIRVTAFSGTCRSGWLQSGLSDASGNYTVSGLPGGQVYVQTDNNGLNYINQWWNGVTDCNAATPVTVTVGQTTPDINFSLAPGGSISGHIDRGTGLPLAGIWVNAFSGACGGSQLQGSQTDASGNYTIAGLPAGNVYVSTWNQQNYINEWWNGVTDCSAATPVAVTVGLVTPDIDFSLTLGGSISGRITDASSQPLQGIGVSASSGACGGNNFQGTQTDASGNYTITGLPAGSVYVSTWNQQNYIDEWWNGVTDCSAATPVTVTVGLVTPDIDFSLTLGGSVSGRITDASSQPLQGIGVSASSGTCGGNNFQGTQTDASGNYTITGLPAGNVYVSTWNDQNYIDEWWNGVTDCSAATPVTVTVGQVTPDIDFSLALGGSISGKVTNGAGQPVAGIWVTPYSGICYSGPLQGSQTDASGNYTLTGLPGGQAYLQADNNGLNYVDQWWNGAADCNAATPVTVTAGLVTPNINFSLASAGSISGKITNGSGTPLEGIGVHAFSSACNGGYVQGSQTDASGNYTITGLPAGNLFVSTWNDHGYLDQMWNGVTDCNAATPVTVTVDQVTPDINFSLALLGSVSGHITDGSGLPLAGIAVIVYSGSCDYDSELKDSQTDASGNYTITGLPAGQRYVRAMSTGNFAGEWWNGVTDCSLASPVAIVGGLETVDIDFSLAFGGTIKGHVADTGGKPLAGIYVTAAFGTCDDENWLNYGTTDAAGDYSIPGLPVGQFSVKTWSERRYVDKWWNGASTCGAASPVTVVVGQETPGINFSLLENIISLPSSWVGSVMIESNKKVVAVGRPHIGSEVASYDGFSAGALSAYIPMLFKNAFGGSYNSAFYVQNVHGTQSANLTIKYYDSDGTLNCTATDSVTPFASKGYWVPSLSCLPSTWVGGVVVTSDQPIVAIGRPHIGAEIMSYDSFSSGSLTSYIPMLFKGAFGGSYNSAFYVQNVHATQAANLTLDFYDSNGTLICSKTDTVAQRASKGYWVPSESCLPAGWVGGAVVTSDRPIVTVGRPHIDSQITTYNGFSSGASSSYVPMLFKGAFGGSYNAAFYVQNVHAENVANLTVKYYDSAGTLSCTVNDTVAPLASKGYWVPQQACLPAGWVGGVVVTSDKPVVAVGRPHVGEQVTTYNGFIAGSWRFALPMLFNAAFGGSYNAAFYIQNTEANPAAVMTQFTDSNGAFTCSRIDTIPALSSLGLWLPSLTCNP